MWVDSGLDPDTFWHQTPSSFQLIMEGVRKRLVREAENGIRHAYDIAALSAAAQAGKLKPIRHYLRASAPKAQSAPEMLTMLKTMGVGTDMKITRIKLEKH